MADVKVDQTILIKDLSTKAVILYPSRAHVTRDINDVILKPGINTIEIFGLAPTVDEHSIQVDGRGAATIVDLSVELVPNRDIFEEVYPDDSEDDYSENDDDDSSDSDDELEAVKALGRTLKALKADLVRATETQDSANQRLFALDKFLKSIEAKDHTPDAIPVFMQNYSEGRSAIFKDHQHATAAIEDLKKRIAKAEREKSKAGKETRKIKLKRAIIKRKEDRITKLHKQEKALEAKYIKDERLRFWPKKVYRIIIQLETATDTPSSSRRGSIDSVTLSGAITSPSEKGFDTPKGSASETLVSLSLSYITQQAQWGPRYDIKIDSVRKTATIVYRTEFINHTSETWKDAKVSFSNSQTSFQGVDDTVPKMNPWHIKLASKGNYVDDGGLLSLDEKFKPRRTGKAIVPHFNRAEFFGRNNHYVAPQYDSSAQRNAWGGSSFKPAFRNNVSSTAQGRVIPERAGGGLFGSSRAAEEVKFEAYGSKVDRFAFGTQQMHQQAQQMQQQAQQMQQQAPQAAFGAAPAPPQQYQGPQAPQAPQWHDEPVIESHESQSSPPDAVGFGESTWEDNGLTATYDIPGTRTLAPTSQTKRHKLASLHCTSVHLNHIAVPKLRAAAFLRTKLRNPSSSVTLLKGSAGVSLDGSFLGNMDVPRTAPGAFFSVPLGVDPAVSVSYPKPAVHRSTQGLFNKENTQVYMRAAWLTNTKSAAVEVLVLDQVPVPEDEKLRIEVLQPAGLREGGTVRAGTSAREGGKEDGKKWGSATASLKKNGEVSWHVKLDKGGACLLKLEYEARMPGTEKIVSVPGEHQGER